MKSLVSYFGCGRYESFNKDIGNFIITKFKDNLKIIPFFEKYPIIGVKAKDYQDFVSIIELMKNKVHLTTQGLEKIRLIQSGMNKRRDPKDISFCTNFKKLISLLL